MLLLPDAVLLSLLQKLSAASMPAELLRMLKAMNLDGRPMPAVEHSTASNTGRSLLTSWLAGPRTRAMKGFEGAACCLYSQLVCFGPLPRCHVASGTGTHLLSSLQGDLDLRLTSMTLCVNHTADVFL